MLPEYIYVVNGLKQMRGNKLMLEEDPNKDIIPVERIFVEAILH